MELATKKIEIDQLKQQITQLQKECEAMKSSTTEVSDKPTHEADQEFHSSVEHQPHLSDQSTELHQKVQQLEAELESTKSAVDVERRNHEEKVKELEMLHQSITLVSTYIHVHLCIHIYVCKRMLDTSSTALLLRAYSWKVSYKKIVKPV